VTTPLVDPSDETAGQEASYAVQMTSSSDGALTGGDTLTLVGTPGTVMPGTSSDYGLLDTSGATGSVATVATSSTEGSPTANVATVTLSSGDTFPANDSLKITIANVENPASPCTNCTWQLWTSQDVEPTTSDPFALILPPPTVTAVSPAKGSTTGGTPITITGTGFVAGATVTIGQGTAPVIAATGVDVVSSTKITATTGGGALAGTWRLYVTTSGGKSPVGTGNYFTYTNPVPTVTAVSPAKGPTTGGTPITITGTGFVAGATVTIGQGTAPVIAATGVDVVSSTKITATTGGGALAGTWHLYVTTSWGKSTVGTGNYFTYQ
jgi:hypothetical protein